MSTDVYALAAEMLAIPSTTRDEGRAVRFRRAMARGARLERHGAGSDAGARQRLGHAEGWRRDALHAHLDTVPPYVPPRLDATRLWGRGACDAKGIAAAMLVAAERLVAAGEERVDLLFVVGEERGSDGARTANQLPATSRFLINGEPTESILASGCKGALRVTVRTRGREAHSAYPELGESAIAPMLRLIPELDRLPLPEDPVLGKSTVNVGLIRGGTEANIIPGLCEAEMMVRLVGQPDPVKAILDKWAAGRAELEYGSYTPAQLFHTVPGFAAKPVAYTTDVPLLSNWGTPLLFGAGSIHVAHTPDEFVALDELRASVDHYERLVRSVLDS